MSGGGGGKAIGYLIENASSNHGTLMVNSTPIVIRSLVGRFPHNFRDLTMIAGTIGDYAAIIAGKDSPYNNFADLVAAYKADPSSVLISGSFTSYVCVPNKNEIEKLKEKQIRKKKKRK